MQNQTQNQNPDDAQGHNMDKVPLAVRIDRSTFAVGINNNTKKNEKSAIGCMSDCFSWTKRKEVDLQFLPISSLDEALDLQKFVGEKNVKVIFVSRGTFEQVKNNRTGFSFAYGKNGWGQNALTYLRPDARNELLREVMGAIQSRENFSEEIEA
jgi:hypothetical protein